MLSLMLAFALLALVVLLRRLVLAILWPIAVLLGGLVRLLVLGLLAAGVLAPLALLLVGAFLLSVVHIS